MLKAGWCAALAAALVVSLGAGCGSGSAFDGNLQSISFETTAVPGGGAGQLYNAVIQFGTEGGAALPDTFTLVSGVLPPGVSLMPDREDTDFDGIPDPDGALTGHVRLLGFPRESGSYRFTIKAISTGDLTGNVDQPDVAAQQEFVVNIGEGSVAILSPTASEGTTDPAVPAFPETVAFVNPADPNAFFSFSWLVAGGSGDNAMNIYLPRELELSVFDAPVVADGSLIDMDLDESGTGGSKYEVDFSDGGWFVAQSGDGVQVGGFQSPRGPVGTITRHAGGPGLDPDWFQPAGVPKNARRTIGENLPGGDTTLGADQPVQFTDYFDPGYVSTQPGASPRAKYPFTADQYTNAFFLPFTPGVDITPLRYRIIVEAIDTRGTQLDKSDDVIARKAYVVQVQIPNIFIDTVVLPGGQAGVDYNEFVNGSGGVPPLRYDLEWVDGDTSDGVITVGHDLTEEKFGLEMDGATGQFFGVPRASGSVDITVRVFADVMNPTQDGTALVPTGSEGEFDGEYPATGLRGRHRTFQVDFAAPTQPALATASLTPGVDGFAYPGDTLVGSGGVPQYVPEPNGFVGTYPVATARRNYAWSATYERDASHGPDAGTIDPARELPNDLTLDGGPFSATGGQISGQALDRGFHGLAITQTDMYYGDAASPSTANNQVTVSNRTLSISPDTVIYGRGKQTAEGAGGEPSGLLDRTTMQGEARMVPMFHAVNLYSVDSGAQPVASTALPDKIDFLPVMIINGDQDEHNRKSIPSVSGFYPAESNTESLYDYRSPRAWGHMQQEYCWLQAPNDTHRRVILWGQTRTKTWTSATTGGFSKRYQQYDTTGERGVLIVDPVDSAKGTWVAATLSNSVSSGNGDGSQFGAEIVMQRNNDGYYGTEGTGYWKYYYNGQTESRWDRELLAVGLGSMIQDYTTSSSNGWYRADQGRSAISVAMSADGLWCATALPGGTNEQKILLWRTDKADISASNPTLFAKSYVDGVDGAELDGTVLPNTAVIVRLGGETFSEDGGGSYNNPNEMRRLNADSLMFVKGGLVFTQVSAMDRIFGICLSTGELSARRINANVTGVGGGGTRSFSSFTLSSRGMYVPDQDYLRLLTGQQAFSAQFAFAGNEPAPGEFGPDKLAFVAGETRELSYFSNDTAAPIDGKKQRGNRRMSLMFLEINSDGCLDLSSATMKDLSGSSSLIYGDFLTPGRPGEELDFVAVSPDGEYVAAVRDYTSNNDRISSFSTYVPTFATAYTSTTWAASDDLVLVSTSGADMDTGSSGTQHVLFLGTRTLTTNSSVDPSTPSYASSRRIFNGRYRRLNGLMFAEDGETLFVNYSSDSSYPTKYWASTNAWAINPEAATSSTFSFGTQMIAQIDFRSSTGSAINFSGSFSYASNALQGLSGQTSIGPSSAPFNDTHSNSRLQFWSTFKSENGKFLYYICDRTSGNTFMVGFNISSATINGRDPFEPFSPHSSSVGFRQFDVNSFNYANRFAAVPGGVTLQSTGRDAAGILCIVANDASAGASNATDLEVYAFDSNRGGNLVVLTSDVTDGSSNAINHLYMSTDGNLLVFQRSKTTGSSRSSRATLNGDSDLCAVLNLHAALFSGAAPQSVVLSEGKSHGSTIAFIGEGTATGPQAVAFSSGNSGGNTTWDDRQLQIALLGANPPIDVVDSTSSHYVIVNGTRLVADNFLGAD